MTAHRRRICVVTGTRADFGLLRWLMHDIAADPALQLQVVATGAHLSEAHGSTWRAIEESGLAIDRRVDMRLGGDSPREITKSLGLGTIGFADALAELRPDLLVLLGDRYEMLAAAQAALLARIPAAHIHGGETTEGAIDEAIRHALTKLSHLHFVAAEPYRRRVIQLGEDPRRVFLVGAIGLDNLKRLPLLGRSELERELGFSLGDPREHPLFVATYHPATLGALPATEALQELLRALEAFPEATVLFTGSNADPAGDTLSRMVQAFVEAAPQRRHFAASLGQARYLSAMRAAALVLGNSSSGIIEAPACGTATVNVGDRQRGRLRASSIIDCAEDAPAIVAAIRRALTPEFRAGLARVASPYTGRDVSGQIKQVLATVPLEGLVVKRFCDLGDGAGFR